MEKTLYHFRGNCTPASNEIFVDSIRLSPQESQQLYTAAADRHSPDGFAWGYYGSGPAQTALAICLHLMGSHARSLALYQFFKEQFVAAWPYNESFEVSIDLTDFLLDHHQLIAEADKMTPLRQTGTSSQNPAVPAVPKAVICEAQNRATQCAYQVGDLVRINIPSMQPRLAIVYEVYRRDKLDFLLGEGYGLSLLSADGHDLGGWEPSSWTYLSRLCSTSLIYEFNTSTALLKDWQQGLFAPYFASHLV